jgi:hypothetical protein
MFSHVVLPFELLSTDITHEWQIISVYFCMMAQLSLGFKSFSTSITEKGSLSRVVHHMDV